MEWKPIGQILQKRLIESASPTTFSIGALNMQDPPFEQIAKAEEAIQ